MMARSADFVRHRDDVIMLTEHVVSHRVPAAELEVNCDSRYELAQR